MNILLTGATGMIGRNFCAYMGAQKNAVSLRTLGRRASGLAGVDDVMVRDFTGSTLDTALGHASIDAVVHLLAAGVHPSDRDAAVLKAINADLPPLLLKLAAQRGAKAFVMAGSSAEYQPSSQPLSEDAPLETEKLYGTTKAAGGLTALAEGKSLGVPVAVARIFNVYGPHEAPHRLLPSLVSKLKHGEAVPLSAGTQIRDFIYVEDVCDALWNMTTWLLDKSLPSGAYNVCTGTGVSVADFARQTARACQADEKLLNFGALPMRPDDVPYLVGSPVLLQKKTGWKAGFTLAEGLRKALETEAYSNPSGNR